MAEPLVGIFEIEQTELPSHQGAVLRKGARWQCGSMDTGTGQGGIAMPAWPLGDAQGAQTQPGYVKWCSQDVAQKEAQENEIQLLRNLNGAEGHAPRLWAQGVYLMNGGKRKAFLMERIPGQSLKNFLRNELARTELAEDELPVLDPRDALSLLFALAQAFRAITQGPQGVVQGDPHDENILISVRDDAPWAALIDFGLGRTCGSTNTAPGYFWNGNFQTTAPEELLGTAGRNSASSMAWTLGAYAYCFLTGRYPAAELCRELRTYYRAHPMGSPKEETEIRRPLADAKTDVGALLDDIVDSGAIYDLLRDLIRGCLVPSDQRMSLDDACTLLERPARYVRACALLEGKIYAGGSKVFSGKDGTARANTEALNELKALAVDESPDSYGLWHTPATLDAGALICEIEPTGSEEWLHGIDLLVQAGEHGNADAMIEVINRLLTAVEETYKDNRVIEDGAALDEQGLRSFQSSFREAVSTLLSSLQEDLDSLQEELDSLSENFDPLQEKIDTLPEDFDSLQEGINSLQKEVDSLHGTQSEVRQAIALHDERISSVTSLLDRIDRLSDLYSDYATRTGRMFCAVFELCDADGAVYHRNGEPISLVAFSPVASHLVDAATVERAATPLVDQHKRAIHLKSQGAPRDVSGVRWPKFPASQPWARAVRAIFVDKVMPRTLEGFFGGCTNLNHIYRMKNLDTSKVTSMRYMFYRCENLKNVDLTHLDTRKVTDMHGMFSRSGVTQLDLSSFDTRHMRRVKSADMAYMFAWCRDLERVRTGAYFCKPRLFTGWKGMTYKASDLALTPRQMLEVWAPQIAMWLLIIAVSFTVCSVLLPISAVDLVRSLQSGELLLAGVYAFTCLAGATGIVLEIWAVVMYARQTYWK